MTRIEPPIAPPAGRLPSLDGLRAISVLMVLCQHSLSTIDPAQPWIAAVFRALGKGSTGVLVFFVISGYLITWLLRRELDRSGHIDLGGFYARRIARIFPVFYAYLLLIGGLTLAQVLAVPWVDLATAGTFLWNYGHFWRGDADPQSWYVGHFWTLALEEQFYLLWPLILLLSGVKRGWYVALALILLMPPMRALNYWLLPGSRGQLGMMLHTSCDALMYGCLLALWERSAFFERLAPRLLHWGVPLAACLGIFLLVPVLDRQVRGFGLVAGQSITCLAVALILLWAVRKPQTLVGRVLNARWVVHIGVLSYGLYIWQQVLLTSIPGQSLAPFPVNLLLCFVAAELSYRIVEMPVLAWRRRRDGRVHLAPSVPPAEPEAVPAATGSAKG
jgi:peptidoglycan/LPS O-acetylase OafA/YrhL